MIGTTRSRVSFFMNRFRNPGQGVLLSVRGFSPKARPDFADGFGRRPWLMKLTRDGLGALGLGRTASRKKIGRLV